MILLVGRTKLILDCDRFMLGAYMHAITGDIFPSTKQGVFGTYLRDITISLEWLSRVSPRASLRLRENLAKNCDRGNAFPVHNSYKTVKNH